MSTYLFASVCLYTIHDDAQRNPCFPSIIDSEPPRFMNCPRNVRRYIETYRENSTSVRWEEPIADDNVGISWPWFRSHAPGTKFAVGDHHVSYVVNDLAGNNVTCDFDVSIIEGMDRYVGRIKFDAFFQQLYSR